MKRVIKHGNSLPSKWIGKCPSCGCEFQYDRSEVRHDSIFQNIPIYVQCPECNQCIRHSDQSKVNISTMQL